MFYDYTMHKDTIYITIGETFHYMEFVFLLIKSFPYVQVRLHVLYATKREPQTQKSEFYRNYTSIRYMVS